MIKNSNLNEVFACTVRMLLKGSFRDGAHIVFSQRLDNEMQFDVDIVIRTTQTKNVYTVQFNDIDLVDSSNNDKPANFTVYGSFRLFQLIESLLEQSMLDGDARCEIYDTDGDQVCMFNFTWEG